MNRHVSKRSRLSERSGLRNLCLCLGLSVLAVVLAPMARAQAPTAVPSRITQPIDETNRITLRGNTHPLARPQYDQGAVADSQPINRMLLLLQRSPVQETALRSLLDQQQSKSSPNYRQWLTPQQFGQQFGSSDADIATVTSWLQSHGFQVAGVSAGRTVIEFSGNAGQVRSAFNTEIHLYVVNGETHLANDSDPQIPAALASVVAGPVSLNNFPKKAQSRLRGVFSKSKATGQVKPVAPSVPTQAGNSPSPAFTFALNGCSATSNNCYALGPADFDTIYKVPSPLVGASPSLDGTGQTIAIVGDSEICTKNSPDYGSTYIGPYLTNVTCSSDDVATFRTLFGVAVNAPSCPSTGASGPVCVVLDGPDPGFNGDEIEGDLDVEWSGAIAPNATIDFVIAENTEASAGIDLAAEHIIDNNLAPVMSESFGSCEAALGLGGNEFYSDLWEQAAAQGITVIISAGDSGSAGCDDENTEATAEYGLAVNGIASTPFNVASGGTDFDYTVASYASTYWNTTNATNTYASAKGYIPETTWNDSCAQGFRNDCGPSSPYLNIIGGGGGPSNCLNFYEELTNDTLVCETPYASNSPYYGLLGYPKPSWQPVATASGLSMLTDVTRDLPDVSLFASDGLVSASFYIICEQDLDINDEPCSLSTAEPFYTFVGVGGTSSSAPTFAGIMALVNQKTASLTPPISRQGNANYVLYPLFANQVSAELSCNSSTGPNSQCTFNDVTKGNNSVPCLASAPNCSTTLAGAIGNLVNSGNAAWNASLSGPPPVTGYNLATGLGTLNVGNLIANWAAAAGEFTPTATTLCLSTTATTFATCVPNSISNITHGATVYVNIGVLPSPGTATITKPEDVALIGAFASGTPGCGVPGCTSSGVDRFAITASTGAVANADVYPLQNGQVSAATTKYMPGGTYTVTAHYPGDGTLGASDSTPPINITVNPESSTTKVTPETYNSLTNPPTVTTPASVQYGDFELVRVDVTGQTSGQETAAGSVALTDTINGGTAGPIVGPTGAAVSSFSLNSEGYLEDQTTYLAVGSHSLIAKYTGTTGTGDGSYNASTSAAAPLTVTLCNTTTTITTPPTTIQAGGQITITAFVDSFTSSNPSGGSSGNNMGGTITFTTPAQSALFRPVGPTFSPNWLAAGVGASLGFFFSLLVGFSARRRWGMVLTTMLLAAVIGTSVGCSKASSSGGGGGGGGGTTVLGSMAPTATTDADGFVAGQASITIKPGSTETITATYTGDTNYKTSVSNSVTITVQ